ncbi:MAG TPA: 30S ribosomal protein S1 [Syntrophales bacterium]|nr:30S ribosomal protein S1 [Syntrophales bacterium]HRT62841.1 30S ribosomal protein S1 [Syntrophales bacterium]
MVNEGNKKPNEDSTQQEQRSAEKEDEMVFKELYEQSLQDIRRGEIVKGRVVQINNDVVMVDVGSKMEGQIPAAEFRDDQGNIIVDVGDEIEVLVERPNEEGALILSKNKAARMKVWDKIIQAHQQNMPVQGTVVERVKGGLSVDIGIPAFLPGSQVDVRPVKDLERFVGQTCLFNIIKYDRERNNVVLSRRAILETERGEGRKKLLETIEEGKVMEGVIKNITDYGIFIDLGGIDGLLHITDISWGKITRPSDSFSRGEKIKVKVLSFDRDKERVSLGLKQLTANPWDTIRDRYPVGAMIEGKVVSIVDYGAFIELEPGVEGLVHVSEMFWTREIRHPSKVLSVGETVTVMVLDVSPENKRISLGLKQTTPNPWLTLKQKYPAGTVIKGKIRNITDFGIFIGVEEGIDGLVHVSDISWKQRIKHPSEVYRKGQEVEAVVLSVDAENEKFSLGIKQLESNPWEQFSARHVAGSVVSGKITNITDFGVFVEVEDGIEGLVHISELSTRRVKSASELFAVGDTITAVVKNVDPKSRKIRLSIREYESNVEPSSPTKVYINNKESVTSNLGKVLADVKITDV